MDISRPDLARKKAVRRAFWIAIAVVSVGVLSWAVSRMKPAAPTVEASTVWRDKVMRGPMLRQVRGLGTLVPEEILLLPALSEGRVVRVVNQPGVEVAPDTVILVLTNPDLEIQAQDAEWKVREAEAKTANLKVELDTKRLDLEANMARLQSELVQARLKSERDDALAKEGLAVAIDVKISRATKEELEKRFELDKKRVEIYEDSVEAQMAAQRVQMEQLQAALALAREKVKRLTVTAGTHGVLQEVNVEVGQQVAPGVQLAKVAQPEKLKAQIRIPETQAKDVQIGQPALIDTRNGTSNGVVARIDPAVIEGTVTVDVRLTGKLPSGARPDLSVDGTVELERLDDVIYMGRPASAQPNSTIGLFKMETDGQHAFRTTVKLGRSSVNFIEVVEGLQPGDEVVLSDMSQWDSYDRVRLN